MMCSRWQKGRMGHETLQTRSRSLVVDQGLTGIEAVN